MNSVDRLVQSLEAHRSEIENCASSQDFERIIAQIRGESGGIIPEIKQCAIVVPVTRDGKLIVLERSPDDFYKPKGLCFPGGQRENGETPRANAIRETNEETSLRMKEGDLPEPSQIVRTVRIDPEGPNGRRIVRIYEIDAFNGNIPVNSTELAGNINFTPNERKFYEHGAYWIVTRGSAIATRVPFEVNSRRFQQTERSNLPILNSTGRFTGSALREWVEPVGTPCKWHWPLPESIDIPYGAEHPGGFGAKRRFDVHTGIDLYCPEGTAVSAVEEGRVVAIETFTGEKVGSPWWNETHAVLVEGASGVVLYGEVVPNVKVGQKITKGTHIGNVKRVLRKDKGKPMDMLHLELYTHGTRLSTAWALTAAKPENLQDPTSSLINSLP